MGKHTNDEKILVRIREGDLALLKKIHKQYWDSFCAYCFKRTSMNQIRDIKEIYSTSFTIFYNNIKDGKLQTPLESSLKTYLIGVGRKQILKHFGQIKKNKEDSTDDLDAVQQKHHTPEVEDQHEKEHNKELVHRLLNLKDLGESCKKILTLSFIEGIADDAIAIIMNIPSNGAVRQKRHKCLEKLKNLLRKK